MTETPDLDAILESIRLRMTGDAAPPAAPPPQVAAPPPLRKAPLVPPPAASTGTTVDALVTSILEPLLRQWIDANLPEICERVAQQEIRRLTAQSRDT
ncbi:DUF2497 domain-containing protein [Polymorphobacter fuscus]|uniref:DUF2497 domain-containing protein n=1 Tax=Sandarakinorhabdus fusca TaxID=1439888 RepID=A0A7C9KNN1_9SPHN|nr:DUF2497 domain-containing protein [Polymorphobacter fuscus]KAB7643700.1 DUF2497 domain-containing protein [Polymorphobacter fuscus]MQT18643.1 DUF2497 domain-containing protein [Polymorphobacter fuscus]NJC08141.1 hypothetical protein [Polymorphobacter fuscus]